MIWNSPTAVDSRLLKNLWLVWQVKPWVKTSLAPGSGVVTKYLLKRYLYNRTLSSVLWLTRKTCKASWFLCICSWRTGSCCFTYQISYDVFSLQVFSFVSLLWSYHYRYWQWQLAWYGSGLNKYLDEQGFSLVGYGCTTCIGNSGELHEDVAEAIAANGIHLLL